MIERGIIFSGPMVRAIREGRKTQTRRLVKGAPSEWSPEQPQFFCPTVLDRWGNEDAGPERFGAGNSDGSDWLVCPYKPGDRLWVREAWRTTGDDGRCDHMPPRDMQSHQVWYEADGRAPADECAGKLRSSIFMPRWASRITLEVVGVRVERLQDISDSDCIAEGIVAVGEPGLLASGASVQVGKLGSRYSTARNLYSQLWESIHGPGSWARNEWVWVVDFKEAT